MRSMKTPEEQIAELLVKVRESGWAEGYEAGHQAAREEILNVLQNGPERAPRQPRQRRLPDSPPPNGTDNEDLRPQVLSVLAELSPHHPEGILPDPIAERLDAPTRNVRFTLRALVDDGTARVAGRGRYLATSNREPIPLPSDLITRAGA